MVEELANFADEYAALTQRAGLAELPGRTLIEVTGNDRAKFIHNLSTNEVRKLTPGSGCETFFTNVQGKTIGHALLFAEADRLWIDTTPGQADKLLPHLDRYLITEDVQLADRTDERHDWLLAGPGAEAVLRKCTDVDLPFARLAHVAAEIDGRAVSIARVDIAGPDGFLIRTARADGDHVRAAFLRDGATPCGAAAFEAARIEAGFPLYGQDITDQNLPQEVGRDALAISFVKGCYLGQETVARIDALGHVNKSLCRVQFEGKSGGRAVPAVGIELLADDKPAGQVTSACYSPRYAAPLALAYVRRGHSAAGSTLTSDFGDATILG